MPRSNNKFRYRYHVQGYLNGITIDKKYCSYSGFLEEFGGTATPLSLNRHKLSRILNQSNADAILPVNKCNKLVSKMWQLEFKRISEDRPFTRVFKKELIDDTLQTALNTIDYVKNDNDIQDLLT